jgi:hypothetical protein
VTVVSYALGRPRTAAKRGGDCRARDLSQGRNVHGPHRFATTTACRIGNGLLRLTVGATGAAPTLAVEVWVPSTLLTTTVYTHTGDYYTDFYEDVYPGTTVIEDVTTGEAGHWEAVGSIVVDSTSVSALLTGVRLVLVNPEVIRIRLLSPLIADAFVTLRRGERMVRIQHGSTRSGRVTTSRRVRLIDNPAPVGVAYAGRVQEDAAAYEGFPRWVASLDTATANAGSFSVTTPATTTARFGAGVATLVSRDRAADHHAQLCDASTARLVTSAA